jgi:hypothetical protein
MKEITTHGDQNYKEYYYYEKSEEDKIGWDEIIARLAREKAIERNKRIDSILV